VSDEIDEFFTAELKAANIVDSSLDAIDTLLQTNKLPIISSGQGQGHGALANSLKELQSNSKFQRDFVPLLFNLVVHSRSLTTKIKSYENQFTNNIKATNQKNEILNKHKRKEDWVQWRHKNYKWAAGMGVIVILYSILSHMSNPCDPDSWIKIPLKDLVYDCARLDKLKAVEAESAKEAALLDENIKPEKKAEELEAAQERIKKQQITISYLKQKISSLRARYKDFD
jgi:hypothetical protein